MNRIRNCTLQPFFEEVRAIKTALFLEEWMRLTPMCELEESYNTMAGQVLSAADQVSWLVDATAAIATARGAKQEFIDALHRFAERVQRGLPEELLPLARLDMPGLTRNAIVALAVNHRHTPESLAASPVAVLKQWMPEATARTLVNWAKAQSSPKESRESVPETLAAGPVLVVDDNQPGEILLNGLRIPLQDKQYRLIRVLAGNPGGCVPYDTIYGEVWGNVIVETQSNAFPKTEIDRRHCRRRCGPSRPHPYRPQTRFRPRTRPRTSFTDIPLRRAKRCLKLGETPF